MGLLPDLRAWQSDIRDLLMPTRRVGAYAGPAKDNLTGKPAGIPVVTTGFRACDARDQNRDHPVVFTSAPNRCICRLPGAGRRVVLIHSIDPPPGATASAHIHLGE